MRFIVQRDELALSQLGRVQSLLAKELWRRRSRWSGQRVRLPILHGAKHNESIATSGWHPYRPRNRKPGVAAQRIRGNRAIVLES